MSKIYFVLLWDIGKILPKNKPLSFICEKGLSKSCYIAFYTGIATEQLNQLFSIMVDNALKMFYLLFE
ncbi:hypothetical protein LDI01_06920 [Lentilactobacillus diolivorans]|uniref:Uncharacterized protein n=1 Tax=Lentilactobacillus diolivorans TaxID=179838 RepID=A0ABQ0XBR2_9LACO|nr:hypothetical protein LDI01_06920 [Lentilactobacillus diolivorans]